NRHLPPQPLPPLGAKQAGGISKGARHRGDRAGQQVRGGRGAAEPVPQRADHVHGSLSQEVAMYSPRRFLLACILALFPLCGCDGRGGSSGLDHTNENLAIDQALTTRLCVAVGGLKICPATRSSAGTPAAAPSVETDLANATSIDCFQGMPGAPCTYTVPFASPPFAS